MGHGGAISDALCIRLQCTAQCVDQLPALVEQAGLLPYYAWQPAKAWHAMACGSADQQ